MKTLIKHILPALVLLSGLFGCTQDKMEMPSPPASEDMVRVKFTLAEANFRTPVSRASGTRSIQADGLEITLGENPQRPLVETRGTAMYDDELIEHLYILQFAHTGNDAADKLMHMVKMNVDEDNSVRNPSHQYTIDTELRYMKDCRVIFLANCDWSEFDLDQSLGIGSTTVEQFKKLQMNQLEQTMEGDRMPMSGQYIGTVPDENLFATMIRMGAQLDIYIEYQTPLSGSGGTLELHTVQLKSTPVFGQYYEADNTPYPARHAGYFHNSRYPESNFSQDGTKTEFSTTWYMPENRAGIGTNTGSPVKQEYKWRGTAPGYPLDYCTHVELKGYFYEPGDAVEPAKRRNITITFYPGADILNDYSVLRNHQYQITANITGVEVAKDDKRVEISELTENKAAIQFFYVDSQSGSSITSKEYYEIYSDIPAQVDYTDGPFGENDFPGYTFLYAQGTHHYDYYYDDDFPITVDDLTNPYMIFLHFERRIEVSFDYFIKDTTTPVEGTPTEYRGVLYGEYMPLDYLEWEGLLRYVIGNYSLHSISPANYNTTPVTDEFKNVIFYYEPFTAGEKSSVTVIRGHLRNDAFIPFSMAELGEPAAKTFYDWEIGSTFDLHTEVEEEFIRKPCDRFGNQISPSAESIIVVKNPDMNIIYIDYSSIAN